MRERGHYWCRSAMPDYWSIYEWSPLLGKFYASGVSASWKPEEFAEIDERRIVREGSGE